MRNYKKLVYYTVLILSLLMMTVLTILSGIFTAEGSIEEGFRYARDPWILQLVLGLITILALYKLGSLHQRLIRRIEGDPGFFKKLRFIFLIVLFFLAVLWVLTTQYDQVYDQKLIFQAAAGLRKGDYTLFEKGQYVMWYPNNQGLIYLIFLMSFVFGNYCYVAFELFNCIALVMIVYELDLLGEHLGLRPILRLALYPLVLLYYPLFSYIVYAYGMYLGFWWILVSWRFARSYLEKKDIRKLLISALCCGLAVMVRMNYLIFLVAILIEISLHLGKTKRLQLLVLPAVLILGAVAGLKGPGLIIRQHTGFVMEPGMSTWSWLDLGLSDGGAAPGWFTREPRKRFESLDWDAAQFSDAEKEIVLQRIRYLVSHPDEAATFFTKKLTAMWTPSDISSTFILTSRSPGVTLSPFMAWLNSEDGLAFFSGCWSLFQLTIYGGILYLLVRLRREKDRLMPYLMALLPVLGGFIVHIFWEGKVVYVLVYFFLMLPVALRGLELLGARLAKLVKRQG